MAAENKKKAILQETADAKKDRDFEKDHFMKEKTKKQLRRGRGAKNASDSASDQEEEETVEDRTPFFHHVLAFSLSLAIVAWLFQENPYLQKGMAAAGALVGKHAPVAKEVAVAASKSVQAAIQAALGK